MCKKTLVQVLIIFKTFNETKILDSLLYQPLMMGCSWICDSHLTYTLSSHLPALSSFQHNFKYLKEMKCTPPGISKVVLRAKTDWSNHRNDKDLFVLLLINIFIIYHNPEGFWALYKYKTCKMLKQLYKCPW